jgi:hypothetical protein
MKSKADDTARTLSRRIDQLRRPRGEDGVRYK